MPAKKPSGIHVVADNRKARHDFFILDTYEAGIELRGSEVKSLRSGRVQLKEGYAHVRGPELFLEGVHITPYQHAAYGAPSAVRSRRLLMHRKEIDRIHAELQQKRLTLVPLKLYFKKGKAKLQLGLAKGKKIHDKRESIKERESQRLLQRTHRK